MPHEEQPRKKGRLLPSLVKLGKLLYALGNGASAGLWLLVVLAILDSYTIGHFSYWWRVMVMLLVVFGNIAYHWHQYVKVEP